MASADLKEPMPWKLDYRNFRETLAGSIRFGTMEASMQKIFDGKKVKTRFGIYWAELKQNI